MLCGRFKDLITLRLEFLFSKLKKYLVGFSPYSVHLVLEQIIEPLALLKRVLEKMVVAR